MMRTLLSCSALAILSVAAARGGVIVADNFDVAGSGTGFALNTGVNTGINPPTTRLTGSAAAGLQYKFTASGTVKADSSFSITDNKLLVAASANSGRFTYSADGTGAFNLAPVLGVSAATPASPSIYDLRVSMANTLSGTARFSIALGTVESSAGDWDFGLQLYRTNTSSTSYQIGDRIDTLSSGLASDINAPIWNTGNGTYGNELSFLIRVTDAGAESTTYNSRVQVSMDNGVTWFYDTKTDAALVNGFRFDGADRFISFDQAGVGSTITGGVTYDNFSLTAIVPEPTVISLFGLGVLGLMFRSRRQF